MPQMAPYNWLYLFITFNFIIFLYITHHHFMPYMKINSPLLLPLNHFKWIW